MKEKWDLGEKKGEVKEWEFEMTPEIPAREKPDLMLNNKVGGQELLQCLQILGTKK